MASFEEFFKMFQEEMFKRGITEIHNPQVLAPQLAEFCMKRMNADDDDNHDEERHNDFIDFVPLFSSTGSIVRPDHVDYSFETLEIDSGTFIVYIFSVFV